MKYLKFVMSIGFLFSSVLFDEFFRGFDNIVLAFSFVSEFEFASNLIHDCLLVFLTLFHDVLQHVLFSGFSYKDTQALN